MNSYALQVEPERYRTKDAVSISYEEALRVQDVRDTVFAAVDRLLDTRLGV